jgi:tellurite resistance protein
MVIHSTFSDFILFLYVHLSNADSSYDPKELAAIKDKMKIIFPPHTDFEKKLYQAIREYNAFDKSKLDDLLHDTATHFKGEKASKQVLDSFYDIVNADGRIGQEEEKALDALKQIIG